jgi:hypothetical protein
LGHQLELAHGASPRGRADLAPLSFAPAASASPHPFPAASFDPESRLPMHTLNLTIQRGLDGWRSVIVHVHRRGVREPRSSGLVWSLHACSPFGPA